MNRPSVADHPDEAMRRRPPAAYRRGIATAAGHHAVVQTELAARPSLLAAFPFPHEPAYEATLRGGTLAIALTVDAPGDRFRASFTVAVADD